LHERGSTEQQSRTGTPRSRIDTAPRIAAPDRRQHGERQQSEDDVARVQRVRLVARHEQAVHPQPSRAQVVRPREHGQHRGKQRHPRTSRDHTCEQERADRQDRQPQQREQLVRLHRAQPRHEHRRREQHVKPGRVPGRQPGVRTLQWPHTQQELVGQRLVEQKVAADPADTQDTEPVHDFHGHEQQQQPYGGRREPAESVL
jgi:hypothetical protein